MGAGGQVRLLLLATAGGDDCWPAAVGGCVLHSFSRLSGATGDGSLSAALLCHVLGTAGLVAGRGVKLHSMLLAELDCMLSLSSKPCFSPAAPALLGLHMLLMQFAGAALLLLLVLPLSKLMAMDTVLLVLHDAGCSSSVGAGPSCRPLVMGMLHHGSVHVVLPAGAHARCTTAATKNSCWIS